MVIGLFKGNVEIFDASECDIGYYRESHYVEWFTKTNALKETLLPATLILKKDNKSGYTIRRVGKPTRQIDYFTFFADVVAWEDEEKMICWEKTYVKTDGSKNLLLLNPKKAELPDPPGYETDFNPSTGQWQFLGCEATHTHNLLVVKNGEIEVRYSKGFSPYLHYRAKSGNL